MKPDTPLTRVPRDSLPSHLQASWDDAQARLRRHFSDAELVELGVIMAVLCGMAKMIFAYDLVEKEDYCPFTPEA